MHRLLISSMLLLLAAAPALADEVQLRNGDRLTGSVVSLAGGTLSFKTTHGDLKIPWSEVTAITVTAPLRITLAKQDPQTVTAIALAEPGRATLTPGGAVALADIVALGPIEPPITVIGGANAGFLRTSGNTDVNTLRLDADIAIRQSANRYTASAAVNHSEDAGAETTDNWTTSLNYDRFLTSRLFLNANAIFTDDRFRDLDLRSAIGGGVGYQVVDNTRVKLTVNGGVGWVNEDFIIAVDDDYTALRESVALDVFAVPDRVLLFHKHDGYFGVTGDDNLFIKSQTGVRLSIVANFVATAQVDLDYDRSPSPGSESSDRTFALTFGYRF